MSEKLISRSPDLRRLRDEGYEVEIRHGFLVVHAIPYVTSERSVALGRIVTDLTLSGEATARPGIVRAGSSGPTSIPSPAISRW